jgi:hypothetical protein
MGVKTKVHWTKREGIYLFIMYYLFFALGNFITREEFIGLSAVMFSIGFIVWFFGKENKEKKK